MGCGYLKYILASASERRQELLGRIIDDFDIVISSFDENSVIFDNDIEKYVKILAEGKAKDVSNKLEGDNIIIAADTIVVLDNKILGKPKSEIDAFNTLQALSGRIHKVYSAIAVLNTKNNKLITRCLYTEVEFDNLTNEEINQYIMTKEPLDKAGSYGIQGLGGVFVKRINGCYYNVVGLPLNELKNILKEIK